MQKFKLVSFKLCPFVQRSVITLEEKGVPYDIEYIDLANKPDWFKKASPLGKVPILMVNKAVIFESAVINEYIDETTHGRLHPEDPLERAQHRSWIEYASACLGDNYALTTAGDESVARSKAAALREKLTRVEGVLCGPLFSGERFSLVDAAWAPLLQRLLWVASIEPSLALFEGASKVRTWAETLIARPSVQRSLPPGIRDDFVAFLRSGGARRDSRSWLGARAA